jgi:hypothetical protein
MKKEIWKDIEGFEGLYKVSNLGNVKSLDRIVAHKSNSTKKIKGQIMSKQKFKWGLSYVRLKKESNTYTFAVIHLVYSAFVEKIPIWRIKKKSRDPLNDTLSNLYVSHGEKKDTSIKLSFEEAEKIRERAECWESQHDIARDYGVRQSTISNIILNKSWAK